MIDEAAIQLRWETVGARLDERGRRLFAAAEVRSAGRGGLALVSKVTGLARSTINRGEDDLDGEPLAKGRVRRAGGGRRSVSETDPGLVPALERLVEPATLGDPMRPLIWVSKSMAKLAAALTEMGHPISADTVGAELAKLGFSRQSNRKADEGSHHPDRNAQFEHINARVVAAQALARQLQERRNRLSSGRRSAARERARLRGQEARQGRDRQCRLRQRRDHQRHRRVCRGVDPLLARTHGTTALSAGARTDDHGGLRRLEWGARVRLWKLELQRLADETGLEIHVHHYPPGMDDRAIVPHNQDQRFNLEALPQEEDGPLEKLVAAVLNAVVKVMQLVDERNGEAKRPAQRRCRPRGSADRGASRSKPRGKTAKQKNPHPPGSFAYAAWVFPRLGAGPAATASQARSSCSEASPKSTPIKHRWSLRNV